MGPVQRLWFRLTRPPSAAHWAAHWANRLFKSHRAAWELRFGHGPDDYTHMCSRHAGRHLEDGATAWTI